MVNKNLEIKISQILSDAVIFKASEIIDKFKCKESKLIREH